MSKTSKRQELAAAIVAMSYGDLIRVADELAQMKRARLETREDFASVLHEWAEAQ